MSAYGFSAEQQVALVQLLAINNLYLPADFDSLAGANQWFNKQMQGLLRQGERWSSQKNKMMSSLQQQGMSLLAIAEKMGMVFAVKLDNQQPCVAVVLGAA